MQHKRTSSLSAAIAIAIAATVTNWSMPAHADGATIEEGGRTFMRYCALCHGLDGTGSGPLTDSLQTPPPALTTISARNAGKFPEARVKEIIEKGGPKGHGMMARLGWC